MTTALDNLLERAYDLEQAGDLTGAATLRAQARGQQPASVDQAPIVPDAWALLFQAATGLYQQGKADGERAILQEITNVVLDDQAAPAAPALPSVHIRYTEDTDGSSWPVFTIGEGLIRVQICPEDQRDGVYLNIGHVGINDQLEDVITLADVARLRDNLTALLNDPRLGGGPAPDAPPVTVAPWICDDVIDRVNYGKRQGLDFTSGGASVYIADAPSQLPVSIYLLGYNAIPLHEIEQVLPDILALLADPRVQAERARYERESAHLMKKAA